MINKIEEDKKFLERKRNNAVRYFDDFLTAYEEYLAQPNLKNYADFQANLDALWDIIKFDFIKISSLDPEEVLRILSEKDIMMPFQDADFVVSKFKTFFQIIERWETK